MDHDYDTHQRRIPTLVQLCQRAAGAHVDSIYSVGDISYNLVKPILERCPTEQLCHLEEGSPHLKSDTAEIWRDLCFRKYRLTAIERYSVDDDPQEPDSWKSRYFALQDAEAKRIDELGTRLRTQRMEAVERKKEKEVKYTDRGLPDPKRARTGSSWNTPSKTLFQRTRHEASKIQRAYNTRVLPPAPSSKNFRVLPQNPGAALPPASPSSSRVIVNTVIHRRPSTSSSKAVASSSSRANSGSIARIIPTSKPPPPPPTDASKKWLSINPPKSPSPVTSPHAVRTTPASSEPTRPAKPPPTLKKDPMASLFVPKRTPKGQVRRPV